MTMKGKLLAKNRKAMFNHTLLEKYTAGIVLKGYEVKAIREGKVDFEGSYIKVINNEVVVINLNIGRYSKQSKDVDEFDSKRSRKLLLNKKEILDLSKKIMEKGKTAVPLALMIVNNNIKLEFAVVKGKKEFEKKQSAKEKQIRKDMSVEYKEFRRENSL
ncbi:SsrA-binding protein SmpB [candidate division WWE3 bacterium]|uniref:SsrA-binding protein n=1 Tax=candidate division WWE3 bacterium TaxID=2053526 RepID=A0A7X9HSJ3_UNCKA|nr:SsrA-binding protein SmpB [candidate division WWE3 bacterium]